MYLAKCLLRELRIVTLTHLFFTGFFPDKLRKNYFPPPSPEIRGIHIRSPYTKLGKQFSLKHFVKQNLGMR